MAFASAEGAMATPGSDELVGGFEPDSQPAEIKQPRSTEDRAILIRSGIDLSFTVKWTL